MCFNLLWIFSICSVVFNSKVYASDNFASLLTANATLAIVIDEAYTREEYTNIKNLIENSLMEGKRTILKHGGLNHLMYSWTSINVKRDFMAILSIASCSNTWKLFRSSETQTLLHMAITESDCPRLPTNKAITIPLIKSGEEISQILLDLRTENIVNWKSLVLLYDQTFSTDMTNKVVKSLTQTSIHKKTISSISLVKLTKQTAATNLKNVLSSINPKSAGKNFMAIIDNSLVGTMMEYTTDLGLVDIESQWVYVTSGTRGNQISLFDKYLGIGQNVAFLYNTTKNYRSCVDGIECYTRELLYGFLTALEESVKEEYEMAEQVSDEEWEAIRPMKSERRDYLLKSIKKYLVSSGVCGNCTSWNFKTSESWGVEYQSTNIYSQPHSVPVGIWKPATGPLMDDELFIHISHGFRRKELPVISFHNPPWQILQINQSGDVTGYSGLVFDIMKQLAKSLNFTIKVENLNKWISDNNASSLPNRPNILTNEIPEILLELIRNRTVAFGACASTIMENAKYKINYTIPISTQSYTLLVARPKELSRALLFTSPFTGDTWLFLTAAIFTMGPILYFIHRLSPVYEYRGIPKKGGLSSVQNCIWYMYGALLQQGGMHLPYADSARIIVGAWWLVVLVLATTYCGNLVAFLTFPKIDTPITNIEDLLDHHQSVSWSFRDGNFLDGELKDTSDPKYKMFYELKSKSMQSTSNLMRQVSEGKHVIIDWKMSLLYIMKDNFLQNGRCDFILGNEKFCPEQLALITAQNTPYLERINKEIKWLQQVGLIEKWLQDYLPKKDRCWKNRQIMEVNIHTVNLDDMQGSFFVLIFGFFIALALFLTEKMWSAHFRKKTETVIQPFTT